MQEAFICDAIRTPFGRYAGVLSSVRADDLGAIPLRALQQRNLGVDWSRLDDIYYGCANQAGEDNRNVARMSSLLAGLPVVVPAVTINRLCGSGLDAVGSAARAISNGDMDLVIAGGVESMSRGPFVMPKASSAYSRNTEIYDTTLGWRFINTRLQEQYGTDSMPETAENVAEHFAIDRVSQDKFALRSQQRAAKAQADGIFAEEIVPVTVHRAKHKPVIVERDEQLRKTSLEALAKLPAPFRKDGTVTAGNASSINDGACALLLASKQGIKTFGLTPKARVVAMAVAGLEPRIMGMGPLLAVRKVLNKTGLALEQMDIIELNEAFAAQALAVMHELGLADDEPSVNPNGGAIAIGHPLGASGARLVTTAMYQLQRTGKRFALCTMCIGVGQGVALILERAA